MLRKMNKMFFLVQRDLDALEKELLATIKSPVELVTEIGSYLVQSGGKRLRPALFFLTCRCGKFDREYVMPLAVAIEMIHTASLVHDDVVDNAGTRRGKPTANVKWGNQMAVLSGDYMLSRAFGFLAGQGYGDRVSKLLADIICDLSAGEINQNRSTYKASKDIEAYYVRIANKTANFLAACCEMGALVSKCPPEVVEAMRTYGYSIGMAFQIKDDLLDIQSDSKTIGKPAGNDIRQGIVTLPVIRALEVSPDRDELEAIVTNPDMTDEDVARALDIVRASDGPEFARAKVQEFLDTAKNVLPESIDKDVRKSFIEAADFIGKRDY